MSTSALQQELPMTASVDIDIQNATKPLRRINLENSFSMDDAAIQSIGAKLVKAKNTSIDILPTEVLEQILSYAEPQTWVQHQAMSGNEDYPLLKTLRLVSSAFNKVASPFLFRTVILYEHSDRYAALNSIANVSYLAPCVEAVKLAQLGYLPDCRHDDEEREQSSHDCRTDALCGSFNHWRSFRKHRKGPVPTYLHSPPDGGPLAQLDFSPTATYRRYLSWRDGERIMRAHVRNGTAPKVDFHLLENIHHVETVGLYEMRVVRRLQNGPPETRRFYETGLTEEFALKGSLYLPLCHLPTFIIASSIAGKELTSLTIHRLDELFESEECENDNPHLQLRSLRRLRIDLTNIWYNYDRLGESVKLALWVRNLDSLEELRIHQNSGRTYGQADVLRLLRRISLPKLKHFELTNGWVGFKVLKTFLSRHNDTLRSIVIDNPVMRQERWNKLRERYKLGALLAQNKDVRLSELVEDWYH